MEKGRKNKEEAKERKKKSERNKKEMNAEIR